MDQVSPDTTPTYWIIGGPNHAQLHVTEADVAAMRDWALDCYWLDGDDLNELDGEEIIRGINRNYDGGLEGFLLAKVNLNEHTEAAALLEAAKL